MKVATEHMVIKRDALGPWVCIDDVVYRAEVPIGGSQTGAAIDCVKDSLNRLIDTQSGCSWLAAGKLELHQCAIRRLPAEDVGYFLAQQFAFQLAVDGQSACGGAYPLAEAFMPDGQYDLDSAHARAHHRLCLNLVNGSELDVMGDLPVARCAEQPRERMRG